MSITPTSGLLAQWERARQVVIVPMGGVQFIAFQQTPAIGTRDLGSCSVVVIASKYGAILAHIPPLPAQPSADPYAGDNNVRSMMGQVKSLHAHYKSLNYFPEAGTSIICAWFRGAVALPDQLQIMQQSLHELGYAPSVRTYNVPGNRTLPGQGTVIVISNASNGNPVIYVEDRAI